ncbi:MAG: hypothetical protein KC635_14035 [Myxococcales bacterium]|nr:hypothetical protein [Myxococcales bacterium]MCB9735412.1 hypothetical protein [Deltaproteobacteria bacterium]
MRRLLAFVTLLLAALTAACASAPERAATPAPSPGLRRVGVICDALALCPFESAPLYPPELLARVATEDPARAEVLARSEDAWAASSELVATLRGLLTEGGGRALVRVDDLADARWSPSTLAAVADGLVLWAPRGALSERAYATLRDYVARGGRLVVALGPWELFVPEVPYMTERLIASPTNIGPWLADLGVPVQEALVVDEVEHGEWTETAGLPPLARSSELLPVAHGLVDAPETPFSATPRVVMPLATVLATSRAVPDRDFVARCVARGASTARLGAPASPRSPMFAEMCLAALVTHPSGGGVLVVGSDLGLPPVTDGAIAGPARSDEPRTTAAADRVARAVAEAYYAFFDRLTVTRDTLRANLPLIRALFDWSAGR